MLLFRFKLSNAIEGDHYIDEPVGWDTFKFLLKRDAKTHSIPFEISTQLKFYRANLNKDGGSEYILNIERTQGVDAIIELYIDISADEAEYQNEYLGKLNLEDLSEDEDYIEVFIEQKEFFTTFNQRYDLSVSFKDNDSVDGQELQSYSPYTLNLHSKILVKNTYATTDEINITKNRADFDEAYSFHINAGATGVENHINTRYVQFGLTNTIRDEINDYSILEGIITETEPVNFLEVAEGGVYSLNFNVAFRTTYLGEATAVANIQGCVGDPGLNTLGQLDITVHVKIYDKDDAEISDTVFYTRSVFSCLFQLEEDHLANYFASGITLNAGDKVKLFISMRQEATYFRQLGGYDVTFSLECKIYDTSYLSITGDTITTASTAPAFRIHDAFQNICNKITGRNDSFHSDFFGYIGAPYHSYSTEGCGADFALLTGHNIRNYPVADRPFQASFKELFESADAIFNLGLGVEVIDGVQKIRVEPKSYFYTKTAIDDIYLDFPAKIQRNIEKELYVNRIEVGYTQWQPEDINGLDEFNSVRQYSLPIKTIGEKLEIKSSLIASGSILEVTRRKQYDATLTTDTKYDNNIFIVALNKTDPTICEKDENFAQVNNLLSPDTAYNLRLSPARNLLRHGNVINSSLLKKVGTDYRFSYGEGNFIMETEFTSDSCPGSYNNELLAEDQDIAWAYAELSEVDPLWTLNSYSFKYPLSFSQFKSILNNRNKALLFTDIDGVDRLGFIIELEYDINNCLGSFKLREANSIPFNYTRDLDNLLLQDGDDFLLEDGGLLIL